ncbi:putative pentatricopeptide repeat-containing protein [Acorus gramineus]|uniref:Pentatricopeptide repeat-containing protein n=1 Tax=Acorus gramineus TaxID=55184 RepID=A0AAV9AN37_ACOGR|nr:putative pentatricopeptide repeat-containing protein [Acorus gramineus]
MNRRLSSSLAHGLNPHLRRPRNSTNQFPFSGPGRLYLGPQIHAVTTKTRFSSSDVGVRYALLSMRGNCGSGSSESVRHVFGSMPRKDLMSWNSIVSLHSRGGDFVSAFGYFSEMRRVFDLWPDEFTFGSLIASTHASPCPVGVRLLEQLLACIAKSGFLENVYVGSASVSAFLRFGLVDEAMEIFRGLGERNSVSMNGLMVGLVRIGRADEAVEVFRVARDSVEANCDSYVVLLSACAVFAVPEAGRRVGREVHGGVIRTGMIDHTVAVKNGLINMYAKCSAIDDARKVFDFMGSKDSVSWNSMISGLDRNGLCEEAITRFQDMRRSGNVCSNFTLISTLSSCGGSKRVRFGVQVHCEAIKLGLDADVSVSNSLLAMYSNCGFVSDCRKVFSSMRVYDTISWNSMIGALADSECSISESIETFLEMIRTGWVANRVTFLHLFTALASLSTTELLRQAHSLVIKYGYGVDHNIKNVLLSCYAKCGEVTECERIFTRMLRQRDIVSWNAMVSAYTHNGLVREAMDLICSMVRDGLKMDPFTLATLVSTCASIASLERGMEIHAHLRARARMSDARAVKEAGRSWVTMRDGVHVFVAGDQSHPEAAGIYTKLGELYAKMREMGYVPRAEFALYDVDAENKEEMLRCHSERLAVAFVLARAPGARAPIRIMKNLRVCGDCHAAFEYISEIVGRRIVLRDANRFHHFEGGKCSCGDYW